MRDFSEADQKKKDERIHTQENPGNLSEELFTHLGGAVKTSLRNGYLSCPVAWKIAKEYNVTKIAVGETADRLHIRITNCQLGCFRVEKTPHNISAHKNIDGEVLDMLKALEKRNQLTCTMVFELARQFKLKPVAIANEMSARDLKISSCQLGCF